MQACGLGHYNQRCLPHQLKALAAYNVMGIGAESNDGLNLLRPISRAREHLCPCQHRHQKRNANY